MKVASGVRCDCCLAIEFKSGLTLDKRPMMGSHDRFFDFVIPPEIDPMTGKAKLGGFPGIAGESNPKQLAALHSCPTCAPKIKKAMADKDPSKLPPGPLRDILTQIKAKHSLRSLRLH